MAILAELHEVFQVVEAQVELGICLFEMARRGLSFQIPVSEEFLKESCGRRIAAPQGIRSTDPRPLGIGGP